MKKNILIGALIASALVHAHELTPLLLTDPVAYNRIRDIYIQEDKDAFLSQHKGSVIGDYMQGPVTPSELYKIYERNELAANKVYKGKSVRVTGTANEIGEDALGKPYIDAISGKPDALNSLRSVKLYFDKASDLLLKTAKGDKVDLICVGKGYIAHTPLLDKCYFTSELNLDNILNTQFLNAENFTTEKLSNLSGYNALGINLIMFAGANAAGDKINTYCQRSSPKCVKFFNSDEYQEAINKYLDDHKEEIKPFFTKVVENMNALRK